MHVHDVVVAPNASTGHGFVASCWRKPCEVQRNGCCFGQRVRKRDRATVLALRPESLLLLQGARLIPHLAEEGGATSPVGVRREARHHGVRAHGPDQPQHRVGAPLPLRGPLASSLATAALTCYPEVLTPGHEAHRFSSPSVGTTTVLASQEVLANATASQYGRLGSATDRRPARHLHDLPNNSYLSQTHTSQQSEARDAPKLTWACC